MAAKFPVISENGNEYQVVIIERRNVWYEVSVYKQRDFLGLFKYWNRVSGGSWDGNYNMENWNYDILRVARNEVRKYENKVANQIKHNKKVKESFNKFKEWDGKIKGGN